MKMVLRYSTKKEMKLIILKNFLFGFVGFLIISYLFYTRLILVKLPKNLSPNLSFGEILILIILILIFFLLFLSNSYKILKLFFNEDHKQKHFFKDSVIFTWIRTQLNTYIISAYWNSLKTLDHFIKHILVKNYIGKNLKIFAKSIIHYCKLESLFSNNFLYIYLILDIMPKFIVLCLFIIDVFIKHKFHYVYLCSWLLLIPLIYKYFLFTFKEFAEATMNAININYIYTKFHNGDIMYTEDHITECIKNIEFRFDKTNFEPFEVNVIALAENVKEACTSEEDVVETLFFYGNQFAFFTQIRRNVAIFESFNENFGIPFNIIRYLFYTLFLIYVLNYGV